MFEATLKAGVLRDMVNVLSCISEEVKIVCGKDGLEVKAVDPAHVAMVVLELSKEAFSDFKTDKDETLCIDLAKVKEVLKLASEHDELQLKRGKDNRLTIKVGKSLTRKMPLLDDAPAPSKIPTMDLPAKVVLTTEKLSVALKASENVADAVEFVANKDGFQIKATSEADEVEAFYVEADLISLKTGDKAYKSMYSLDYIMNLLRGIPVVCKTVEIEMGENFPARIHFPFADDKGSATYLIAPRIENQ